MSEVLSFGEHKREFQKKRGTRINRVPGEVNESFPKNEKQRLLSEMMRIHDSLPEGYQPKLFESMDLPLKLALTIDQLRRIRLRVDDASEERKQIENALAQLVELMRYYYNFKAN